MSIIATMRLICGARTRRFSYKFLRSFGSSGIRERAFIELALRTQFHVCFPARMLT